jgi:hypothetical protein
MFARPLVQGEPAAVMALGKGEGKFAKAAQLVKPLLRNTATLKHIHSCVP